MGKAWCGLIQGVNGPQGATGWLPGAGILDTLRTPVAMLADLQVSTMTSFSDYYYLNTENQRKTKEVCFGNMTFSYGLGFSPSILFPWVLGHPGCLF